MYFVRAAALRLSGSASSGVRTRFSTVTPRNLTISRFNCTEFAQSVSMNFRDGPSGVCYAVGSRNGYGVISMWTRPSGDSLAVFFTGPCDPGPGEGVQAGDFRDLTVPDSDAPAARFSLPGSYPDMKEAPPRFRFRYRFPVTIPIRATTVPSTVLSGRKAVFFHGVSTVHTSTAESSDKPVHDISVGVAAARSNRNVALASYR